MSMKRKLYRTYKDDTIVIVPVHKGKAVVVLNKSDHDKKCKELLSNKSTYKWMGDNPTSGFRKKAVKRKVNYSPAIQ